MDLVWEGIRGAFRLLVELDPEVLRVTALTLAVSGSATLVATAVGVVLGSFLALASFPGRRLALALVNTGMGLPPVAVGLLVAVLLWRSGPLGALGLIYTPAAMVIAQAVIALPIVTGFTAAAIGSLPPRLRLQVLALGASRWQALWLLLREARLPLLAAVMAGFGAAISEVGASLMVGGNIQGETRVLTTAIVLETSRGNFDLAIALSLLLLALVFAVNLLLTTVQQRRLS
ncbi:MAG: ABC transporter permease [Dehalococcoidia bacterium]|nr:ABC transporter permease [Dehalococcoidia bacterium]MDW8008158.1 ABC transporter permease [Chloroflexota bacterium]